MDSVIEVTPCKYDGEEFGDYGTESPTHYYVKVPLDSGPVDMYLSTNEAELLFAELRKHF